MPFYHGFFGLVDCCFVACKLLEFGLEVPEVKRRDASRLHGPLQALLLPLDISCEVTDFLELHRLVNVGGRVEVCHLLHIVPEAAVRRVCLLALAEEVIPVASTDELGFLAANEQDLLADLGEPASQRQLICVDFAQVEATWLVKVFRVVLEVLLGWLIERVERAIEAHVPVLVSLLILIAVVGVSTLKVVDDALLDRWLHPRFLLDQ